MKSTERLGRCRPIRSAISAPLIPGMITSVRTRSGRRSCALGVARASRPLAAAITR